LSDVSPERRWQSPCPQHARHEIEPAALAPDPRGQLCFGIQHFIEVPEARTVRGHAAERERDRDLLEERDLAETLEIGAVYDRRDAALRQLGHREAMLVEEAHSKIHARADVREVRHVRVRVHVGPAGNG